MAEEGPRRAAHGQDRREPVSPREGRDLRDRAGGDRGRQGLDERIRKENRGNNMEERES